MIHAYYAIPNNLYVLFTSKFEKTNKLTLVGIVIWRIFDEFIEEIEHSLFIIPVFFQSAEIKS